ncbi:MAG: hypothetical protein B6D63_05685 [Candidatus Latescibacteria bacterium 4484_7]|nr:MAG: hypothetical protein B6D63_05685 [Candidatus Latescibacteria bacterium 4484_7]
MAYTTIINTVRHAQSEFGVKKKYAGSIDVGLSGKGARDALRAAKSLGRERFDIIIASTLRRAIETAELLTGKKKGIVKTGLCRERNYGVFEGKTYNEAKAVRPKVLFIRVGGDTHSVNPPGSEPFEDVRKRAEKFKRFIFKNYKGKNILVVSHMAFLQQFNGLLKGLSCIESLAEEIPGLRLNRFTFRGNSLIDHSFVDLCRKEQVDF